MSEPDHALELLAGLNASDRSWIVQRLSSAAKSRLISTPDGVVPHPGARGPIAPGAAATVVAATETASIAATGQKSGPGPAPADSGTCSVIVRLAAADPDRICATLRAEPGWLVCSVLRASDWPWSRALLQAVPAPTRAEIARLERHGIRLAKPALETLLQSLAERVRAPSSVAGARSRFEGLLARMRRMRPA